MDIMIDIETLGTKPGSIILSIGAAAFDPVAGTLGAEFSMGINPRDCERIGFNVAVDTLMWWAQQSEKARERAFTGRNQLEYALDELGLFVFLNAERDLSGIWAHSPSFDIAHLDEAYDRLKIVRPWSYKQAMDTRTLYALADVSVKDFMGDGVAHDPLDDARAQARAVIAAYAKLGLARAA